MIRKDHCDISIYWHRFEQIFSRWSPSGWQIPVHTSWWAPANHLSPTKLNKVTDEVEAGNKFILTKQI